MLARREAGSPVDVGAMLRTFEESAFRLELRDSYNVPQEAESLAAYLAGDPLPPPDENTEWVRLLEVASAAGKRMQRVHVITRITPYVRWEIDWGYLYSADAGEDIRILVTPEPRALLVGLPFEDFWLFDSRTAVRMHYDEGGRLVERESVTDPMVIDTYRQARDVTLRNAVPLRQFLSEDRHA